LPKDVHDHKTLQSFTLYNLRASYHELLRKNIPIPIIFGDICLFDRAKKFKNYWSKIDE